MTLFRDSPKMSPYLLAFVVADFEFLSNEETIVAGEISHRTYARPEVVASTRFALEHSELFLKELESFVSFKYELSQVYHVAIPDFFYSKDSIECSYFIILTNNCFKGEMANWGLITYKENILIGDEDSDVLRIQQAVAHELAHQFFGKKNPSLSDIFIENFSNSGNSVTCKYLGAMWLNEGFATYFEHKLIEIVHPELRSMDFFNVQKLQNALHVDALESTHALNYDGETVLELVYGKRE